MTLEEVVEAFKAERAGEKKQREDACALRLGESIKKFMAPDQEDIFKFNYKEGYAYFTCGTQQYRLLYGDGRWYLSGQVREGYGPIAWTILLEVDTNGLAYKDLPLYGRLIEYLATKK